MRKNLLLLCLLILSAIIHAQALTDVLSGSLGTMGTQTGVSAMGGASCSVPIKVPQGVGGLQPSLSITYNSQSGNGLAGYGAGLTGLSSITRGPKDIYHDGDARGITYTSNDALYLDGVRLVLESGTPGQDGAVYTPEFDPFSKVIAHGTCTTTSNSTWYEVRSSDGMVYHYGNSQDSRLSYTDSNGSQKIHSWYLCHAQQPTGNYMTYYYHTYSHCVYPFMITYGTNINHTSTLANIIEFSYESRNDTIPIRFDGVSGSMDRRLKSISSSTNGSIYRTYTLSYNSTSDGSAYKYSRLTGITEKNSQNQSLPSTQFNWSYLPSVSYSANDLTINHSSISDRFISFPIESQSFMSGDFNGDGLTDIVGIGPATERNNQGGYDYYTYVYIHYASVTESGTLQYTNGSVYKMSPQVQSGMIKGAIDALSVIDVDGDGTNELCVPYYLQDASNSALFVYVLGQNHAVEDGGVATSLHNNGKPLFTSGDIDNDGRTDVVFIETTARDGSYPVYLWNYNPNYIPRSDDTLHGLFNMDIESSLSLGSQPESAFISDMNGNGLNDLLIICQDGYSIFWNQGSGITSATYSDAHKVEASYTTQERCLTAGDFNGDGLLDFLTNTDGTSNWYFHLGNGNGSFTRLVACTLGLTEQYFTDRDNDKFHCDVLDFDGDGLSDVVITKAHYNRRSDFFGLNVWGEFNKTHTYWMRSTGDGLEQVYHATSNRDDDALACRFITGDFNGDGRIDLVNYGYDCVNGNNANSTPQWRLYRNNNLTPQSGKVTSVKGDLGMTTSFTYTNLTDGSVYTRGPQHDYPSPSYTLPISVVECMTQDYGESTAYTTRYSYEGLRVHLQGRGLLGFSRTTVNNTTTGIMTETAVTGWSNTYYVPVTTYTRTTVSGETSLATTELSISCKDVNGRKRYFVYRSRMVDTDMDQMSVTTSRICDTDYGYVLCDSTIYSPDMYSLVTYSAHVLAGGTYRPQSITTTQKHADDSQPFSTTSLYAYDIASGALIQRTANSHSTKPLTTTYTNDVWGNVTSEVSTGIGISTPLTTYYSYDPTHRFPSRVHTAPSSSVRLYTYDLWGNVLTERDSINASADHTTQYTYDSWGNLISTQIPGSGEVSYTRGWGSDASRLYYILEQGTARPWTKTWYDSHGREVLTESVGPLDTPISTSTVYNLRSEVVSTTSVQGDFSSTVNYTYDSRGRVTLRTLPGENTVEYNYSSTPASHLRTVTVNDNGRRTTTVYDALDNVKSVTGPISSLINTYRSNGGLHTTVTEGSTWTFSYDDRGHRTSMTDPDAGTTTYTYDALGREMRRVDGRGVAYVTSYDYLGRVTQKKAGSETIRYTYWTTGPGQLLLKSESYDGWTRNYAYDELGRVTDESMTRTGEITRTRTYQYGPSGLLTGRTLPGGMSQAYSYDAYGNLTGTDFGSGTVVWSLSSYSGRRRETETRLNGYGSQPFLSTRLLDSYGYLDSLIIKRGSSYYQQEDYGFSPQTGNLMSRNNLSFDNQETFTYDSEDRLTGVSQHGQTILSMIYSRNGNINTRTGMGTYTYGSASKPHAVTAVDNTSGDIDYNSQDVSYNNWNRVSSVWQYYDDDCYGYSIEYGPDLRRVRSQFHTYNNLIYDMFYWDDYEEKTVGTDTLKYYYLYTSGELDALHIIKSGPSGVSTHTTKVITDHLGSITGLADNYYMAYLATFDAWGNRDVYIPYWFDRTFNRGYTGHEHIDELGLINMNGRMYDSRLGRFLSPDPFVQAPSNPQNYNRYSYCLNNPLKYTDPSGEFLWAPVLIGAAIYGVGNTVAHGMRGDIDDWGDGLKYFSQGALTGAALGATWSLAPSIPLIGKTLQSAMTYCFQTQLGMTALSSASGILRGVTTGNWNTFKNSAQIFLGNYYLDENASFLGGVLQGCSRHSWEMIQTCLGNVTGQVQNTLWGVSDVYYSYGATIIKTYSENWGGFTLGSFILGDNGINALSDNSLFQHEYGHSLQSRVYGVAYLFSIGIPSAYNSCIKKDPAYYTELYANKRSLQYFMNNVKNYGSFDDNGYFHTDKWDWQVNPLFKTPDHWGKYTDKYKF